MVRCRHGRGARGGAWHRPRASKPDVSFLLTEQHDQDTVGLELAAQMLELLAVDPASYGDRAFSLGNISMAFQTAPLPGESAGLAGQMELAYIVGTFLLAIHEFILLCACDNHGSSGFIKRCFFGQITDRSETFGIPCFDEMTWRDFPPHNLPRLQFKIALIFGVPTYLVNGPRHIIKNWLKQMLHPGSTLYFACFFVDARVLLDLGLPPSVYALFLVTSQSDRMAAMLLSPYFNVVDLVNGGIPWSARGWFMMSLTLCFGIAALTHGSLSMVERCECAATGFLASDICFMLARAKEKDEGQPAGSFSMSTVTLDNYQQLCVTALQICASLETNL